VLITISTKQVALVASPEELHAEETVLGNAQMAYQDFNRSYDPRYAVHSPKSELEYPGESTRNYHTDSKPLQEYARPKLSFGQLIVQAISSAEEKQLTLNEIYASISKRHPFYSNVDKQWQNSIRHNLSLNKCFQKVPRSMEEIGRGSFWRIDPYCELKPSFAKYTKEGFLRENVTTSNQSGQSTSYKDNNRIIRRARDSSSPEASVRSRKRAKKQHREPSRERSRSRDPSWEPPSERATDRRRGPRPRQEGPKPPYSYTQLIVQALKEAKNDEETTLNGIYTYITEKYDYYANATVGWKNSIRHNLSLNNYFLSEGRPKGDPGRGKFWRIDPLSEAHLVANAFIPRTPAKTPNHNPGSPKTKKRIVYSGSSSDESSPASSNGYPDDADSPRSQYGRSKDDRQCDSPMSDDRQTIDSLLQKAAPNVMEENPYGIPMDEYVSPYSRSAKSSPAPSFADENESNNLPYLVTSYAPTEEESHGIIGSYNPRDQTFTIVNP